LRIAETILVEAKQVKPQPILDFAFAEIMQTRLPMPVLAQVFRNMRGQKNMSSIAAIHHSLRHVDSGTGYIRFLIHIGDSVDRAAVNSHSQLDTRMILQRSANFERTSHRLFGAVKKNKCHSVAGRHSNEFAACFRSAKTFSTSYDLLQLLEQFDLLVHKQLGITYNVDQQEMCNLELEISRRFRGRVLRVHPVVLRILTAAVGGRREQMGIRADENPHPNECSFPPDSWALSTVEG